MIDRKVLLEKMQQFGIDWIGSSGFLDEGQVNHVLDIVEKESGLTKRAPDYCFYCNEKKPPAKQSICQDCVDLITSNSG